MAVTHVHEAEDKVTVGISVPPGVGSVEVTIRIAPTTSHAPVTVVPDEPRADELPVGENVVADEVPDVDDPIAPPTEIFNFGKYKGRDFAVAYSENPKYASWLQCHQVSTVNKPQADRYIIYHDFSSLHD
jgi:hypothetical protein